MPGFDRTGPLGQGPMTGRGMGYCGKGFSRGRGFGMGRRFFQPRLSEKEEKEILQEELKAIEEEKNEIEQRLKELK